MQNCTTIIGILQMIEDGYPYSAIRGRYCVGNSVITNLKKKFNASGYTIQELKKMKGDEVETIFYGDSHPRQNRPLPDFGKIYDSITDRKSRTNLYFFWIEYKKKYPHGYQYTQFKFYFKKWLKENHLEDDLTMLVERVPGEIVYIDWMGDTLECVADSKKPGRLLKAHFFITTVGVSDYTFAMAFPNEQLSNFVHGTVEALNFYGVVPKILKPDNARTAVTKNTKDELILNSSYSQLQDFYHVVIVPTPPIKPRGKPTVENGVRWLETYLLESIKQKNKIYPDFDHLNLDIADIMDELNKRPFKDGNGNRKELFEAYDKPKMSPLPVESFTYYEFKYISRVSSNYHVSFDDHLYSVPYTYYNQAVMIKASYQEIIIVDMMNVEIARHRRAYTKFPKNITNPDHLASTHHYMYVENNMNIQDYKNWAKSICNEMYVFICRLFEQYEYPEQAYHSCNAVLHMCKRYPKYIVSEAAQECIDANVCRYSYLKKALKHLTSKDKKSTNEKLPAHKNIRGKDEYK